MGASEADLATTEGVGGVIAASVVAWFAEAGNRDMVERLRAAGVDFGNVVVSRLPQVLAGKAVVVTGTLEGWSREEAEDGHQGPRRQEPGQRVEEDLRGGGRRRAGRGEAHQGGVARGAGARRSRLRRPAGDRRAPGKWRHGTHIA